MRRPCLVCGRLANGSRCPAHKLRRTRDQAQGTTTSRGLGWAHQQLRRQLLPAAIGTPCPICGRTMTDPTTLDLDHINPRRNGGTTTRENVRVTHAKCNRGRR